MDDCLFCKIIKGDIPSQKVYEDDKVLVFLDINPTTNGDSLLVPKDHYVTYDEIPDDLLLHMRDVIKKIEAIDKEKLGAEGITLINNNGMGQEIKHFHIHLMPRYEMEDFIHQVKEGSLMNLDEVHEIMTK
jgi:histidine triad (HIT) family protein